VFGTEPPAPPDASQTHNTLATALWHTSFAHGGSPTSAVPPRSFARSSTTPTTHSAAVDALNAHTVGSANLLNTKAHTRPAGTNAAPPIVGVAALIPTLCDGTPSLRRGWFIAVPNFARVNARRTTHETEDTTNDVANH